VVAVRRNTVTTLEVRVRRTFFGLGCGVLLLVIVGCGDDDEHSGHGDLEPDCQAIVDACHEADPGSGPAHDCHVLAEENNAGTCAEQRASCVSVCQGQD
jgi:hypothetical protein